MPSGKGTKVGRSPKQKPAMTKKQKTLLSKGQESTLAKHSVHHKKKHMSMMRALMRKGVSFSAAHKKAQKEVGT